MMMHSANERLKVDSSISIVIPVYGDSAVLKEILEQLESSPDSADEIIIVDGAAHQRCRRLCARRGCLYLTTAAGRGKQLDAGAQRACSDIIWFLHADCRPPPAALRCIRRAIRNGATGGYFRFRFTGPTTWYKRLLAGLINLRCRAGIPYGDQGLFILRSHYTETGGFPDMPLFEEVPLVKAARRSGCFVQLDATIGVSPRRWERDGWCRRTIENRLLALGYAVGISPATLARRYYARHAAASE
jgi:rSAM/selenodomain-associated transferase 2